MDELFHPVHSGDGELNIFIRIRTEIIFEALGNELRVRLNHAQRFLQLMRNHERKSPKLLV
jgi:hypothetical protein